MSVRDFSTPNLSTSFAGRYYVVTGSTQGLGAAVARTLALRGAAGLIICGRSRDKGEQQVRLLAELDCQAFFVEADMENVEDCRRVVAAAKEHFGTVHGLVNCAGMSDRGTIVDTSPELFDRIFAVNVKAPFFLMQECIKLMIANKVEGSIVSILSVTGHGGQSFLSAYAASKGALAVLTVDHGVRAESAADASFVVALAEERGLPHRVVRATAAGDDEAALRAVRQEAFDEAVAAGAVVATAHHREDQAETVLLQLLRSTGTAGRRGMRWASHGRVRPLLGTPAASVAAWAEARELSWREDPTNRHPHYLRNRVRHELLPLLESLRGGATASLARSAAHAAEDDALLERLAAEALTMNQLGDGVRTSFIAEGPPALTRRALRARWPELGAQ